MPNVIRAYGMNKCIGCLTCMMVCSSINEHSHSVSKSRIKVKTAGGLQGKFVCNICHGCSKDRPCIEACPTGALKERPGGGVILESQDCIGCRKCAAACSIKAVFFDASIKKPLICKHCGACVKFCPHGCLKMEEVQ